MVIKPRKCSLSFEVDYDPKTRAGQVEITFHDLRKSCRQTAERLLSIMLDVRVKELTEEAGHSPAEITTRLIKGERFAVVWIYEFTTSTPLPAASAAAHELT
ncbi:hypothetical protein [Arthrobacter sp. ES1]|uniref:hypothetical protein n=1 Tax=Arthrobacter sp. ES1 TaxID=1897056 RepID=UPI001CFFB311|nr:hypothetical protein [Arthrobacter sp. ES1]MCB5280553.1 hypothetical protein [Arthrobacter sp. ES1]